MTKPIAWTIAGTDPSGGAGIQADLKTMNALGVHGGSVITAVIAQNTQGVRRIEPVSGEMIDEQLNGLREDIPPVAVKIGMLGAEAAVRVVSRHVGELKVFTVYDPVMVSGSGHSLFDERALGALKAELLPKVSLLTPNIPEAEVLLGRRITNSAEMMQAAVDLTRLGVQAVYLKGGHRLDAGEFSQDYFYDGRAGSWLTSPRRKGIQTHGTGCTLSSALAAFRALGLGSGDGAVLAKAYVNQGIRRSGGIGRGRTPLSHDGWPEDPKDLPWITARSEEACEKTVFPGVEAGAIGLYPIVDRAAWLEKLLPLGVKTVQLRIKDLSGAALENEIRQGIEIGRRFSAHLYINDQWPLALKYKAYGVHLGQDDLPGADLKALAAAGLRLGLSTHTYEEIAQAHAVRATYVAIGSVYPTSSKSIDYVPLGLEPFRRMRRLIDGPAVAIGGITLERAPELREAGADGMAVIADIVQAGDLRKRVTDWLAFSRSG